MFWLTACVASDAGAAVSGATVCLDGEAVSSKHVHDGLVFVDAIPGSGPKDDLERAIHPLLIDWSCCKVLAVHRVRRPRSDTLLDSDHKAGRAAEIKVLSRIIARYHV